MSNREIGVAGRFSLVIALFFTFSLIVSDHASQMVKDWVDVVFIALSPRPVYMPAPAAKSVEKPDSTIKDDTEIDVCPSIARAEVWTPGDITSLIATVLQFLAAISATVVSYLAIRPKNVSS